MSRIGRMSISIPSGVDFRIEKEKVSAKSNKGSCEVSVPSGFQVAVEEGSVKVIAHELSRKASRKQSMMHGTLCRLIRNMIHGLSQGFEKDLQLVGVGYRAELQGKSLKLALGYSHDIFYPIPEGISMVVEKQTLIKVSGIDKHLVGQVASEVVRFRPPEPYKGKGVRIVGQFLRMKEGKK
jgi:large subunit ribosomal protein L6